MIEHTGHVGIFLLGDGDALRGSDKVEDKNGTKSCPWTLSEQNSECGEENFGRADVLRPILTEEERKSECFISLMDSIN